MGQLESAIERSFVKRCPFPSLKISGAGRGIPDRLVLLPGRPLFIEFKRPGGKPTPLQLHVHEKLRKLGYAVEVHDDADEALRSCTRHVEAARIPKNSSKVALRASCRCFVPGSRFGENF
jgi:VRR-NUC domain.